jgi:hypothetical protein
METFTASKLTTDHDEIRRWTEERGGYPALVQKLSRKGPILGLRLSFPGYSTGEPLERIAWTAFFQKFDDEHLALRYQEIGIGGGQSHFHNLVNRLTGEEYWPGVPLEKSPEFRSKKRTKRLARLVG